jgi:hypothetical protein
MCHTNETKRLNEITVYYTWKFALLSCEQWCNRTSDEPYAATFYVCTYVLYVFMYFMYLTMWYFLFFILFLHIILLLHLFYVVCSSSIYGVWLPLWYLQTLLYVPHKWNKKVESIDEQNYIRSIFRKVISDAAETNNLHHRQKRNVIIKRDIKKSNR